MPDPAPPKHAISEPCPEPFNLAQYVLAAGRTQLDKIALAIVDPGGSERWSYDRLSQAVERMAGALSQCADPGDFVLLRLANTPGFPIAFLASIWAGLVPVPTAAGLTKPEITALASRLPIRLILADPGLSLPDVSAPVIPDPSALSGAPIPPNLGSADRLAYAVFTSGSSGDAKAVAHAHRAIWARRMMRQGWDGIGPDDRVMHSGAFNWTYTLGTGLLDPWSVGATAVIPREGTDPQTLPLLLKRHDITIFASVPGIYRKILKQSTAQILPKLRHGLSAGEALSVDLRETWEAATGTAIHEALGMSECSTYLSSAPGRPAPRGSTGYVQSGRAVAVLDLGPGGVGELAIREDEMGLMLGYLDEAGQPHLRLDDGWFRTGDLVRQAEDGAIATAGRRDDLITAGGFRIAPQEIEAAFEGLGSCAAFSAPLTSGAFVVALAVEGAFSEDDARARAEACLAAYKRPRIYIPCAALPRNPNGKLNRRALTELWPELSKAHK